MPVLLPNLMCIYSKVPNKRAGEINVQAGFFHNFNKRAGSNKCAGWIFSE